MIADIKKTSEGYRASMTLTLASSHEDVWAMLVDDGKRVKWFPELVELEPHKNGRIRFDMGDGTVVNLKIDDLVETSLLSFDWFGDHVQFRITQEQANTLLVFTEEFKTITDQTAKDIAGWHVCLLVIEGLLDGPEIDERMELWKPLYEKYKEKLNKLA